MDTNERRRVLQEHFSKRRHRRDKPGRAFENVCYTFDVLGNLGLYRDLHRHRILTQERQAFTTVHGYDTPREIGEAGFGREFGECMNAAAGLYEEIYHDLPFEAQYVVPFAYKIRWYMKMNLVRQSTGGSGYHAQAHPDYRFIAQRCGARSRKSIRPGEVGRFIDCACPAGCSLELRTEFKSQYG
jgi:hypothetical protein